MPEFNKYNIFNLIEPELQELIDLELHSELDSTNSYLLNQPLNDKVKVCFADTQTAGRGRHGREWYSAPGHNLYLSFAHRLKMDSSSLSGLSLVVGITLANTLQAYCEQLIGVKWPNDLLVNGKKLSGILIEIKSENNGFCKVVTGLGINMLLPGEADKIINQPTTSLSQCQPVNALSRTKIAADIVNNVINSVQLFSQSGFSAFYQQWNQLDVWFEQLVEIQMGNRTLTGKHRGVDLSGNLLLEIDGKLTSCTSGEVRLRSIK